MGKLSLLEISRKIRFNFKKRISSSHMVCPWTYHKYINPTHGFCSARQDIVGDNTECGAVVGLDWGWWLRVAHFVEDGTAGDCFTFVDVERAKFGFCC